MRTIAVINQKGGVGKTTTVTNLAAALARNGSKVAIIDLDPQAHLTIHFGVEPEGIEHGSYEVLSRSVDFEKALIPVRPNLWLLAANINLVGAENELVGVIGRETILREAIKPVKDKFQYLIVDCPPSLGLLTLNALAAVNEVFIPVQPHFLALRGLGKLLQTVSLVRERINRNLKVSAILFCLFDGRVSLTQEVKADISRFFSQARNSDCPWSEAQIVPICIRRNIKLAEAPSYGKTIFEYEQNCHGAEDYSLLAEYVQKFLSPPSSFLPVPEVQPEQRQPSLRIVDVPDSHPPAPMQRDGADVPAADRPSDAAATQDTD